ncbi:MAG: hypothetical protein JXR76_01270 [Deltaproteobacteria bacterium]|nr:hypothetical protein [Deltaproteobacteria bacterium]
MALATKVKPASTSPAKRADEFIDEMERLTGCSRHFLEEARPSLEKLYRDVEGEALDKCLVDIRELIHQQAETERICASAKRDAQKLDQMQIQLDADLKHMRRQVTELRNTLQATSLMLRTGNRFVADA